MENNNNDFKIDPWSSSNILEEDYLRLIKEFGIEQFNYITLERFKKHRFIRRKVIFGHRELGIIYKAIEKVNENPLTSLKSLPINPKR